MRKKVKISKKQNDSLNELNVMADTGATGGNLNQAVQNAQITAKRSGVRNPSIVIPPTNESIFNKKQIESLKLKTIKEKATRITKKELDEFLHKNEKNKLNENFSELRQLGLFELADSIITAKNNFSELVDKFFGTLLQKGYKFKDITDTVSKMQLDGIIPKTMINKIESNHKAQENEKKNLMKDKVVEK